MAGDALACFDVGAAIFHSHSDDARDCLCCFGIEIDDCNRSSLGGIAKRDCLADTLPAACHNHDLARKHALQFDLPLFGQGT